MIEIILATITGILFGIITGLMPGLHVNTIGIIIFSSSDMILNHTKPITLCSFFVSIAMTHAMLEFIPSLIFGVATEDTLTSIQPGHKLLFEGEGRKAIRLVSFGGYLSIIILILLLPLLFMILPIIYDTLNEYIAYLLIITMIFMLYYTNKNNTSRLYSSLIFLASGIMGITILKSNLGGNLGLLATLSGLFSISTLLYSINNDTRIPPQKNEKHFTINNKFIKSVTAGSISGCILGLLPGLGPAQGTVIAQSLTLNKNITAEDYLLTNSGVNISDTIFSLISIYLINNPRSAISMYISYLLNSVKIEHILFFIFIGLLTVSITCIISIKIGDFIIHRVNNFDYHNLSLLIVMLITVTVIFYSLWTNGCLWYVLLCYITSIGLGMIPNILDISKSNLMGILIIPSILTYLGLF